MLIQQTDIEESMKYIFKMTARQIDKIQIWRFFLIGLPSNGLIFLNLYIHH